MMLMGRCKHCGGALLKRDDGVVCANCGREEGGPQPDATLPRKGQAKK